MRRKHFFEGSEKDSKTRRSDEDKSGWDGMGGYMRAKIQKLDAQFKKDTPVNDNGSSPNIFNDVVVHVNGYTVPSTDELRRMVYKHGGSYQQYYRKSTVTHIIATNLPDSKIKQLRNEKVVRPEWIVDSVKANRLLPERDYLLYQRHGSNQGLLSKKSNQSAFSKANEAKEDKLENGPNLQSVFLEAASVSERRTKEVRPHSGGSENDEMRESQDGDLDWSSRASEVIDRNDGDADNGDDLSVRSKSAETHVTKEGKMDDESGDTFKENENETGCMNEETENMELETELPLESDNDDAERPSHNEQSVPRAGDANFVSEFYKNSRLHYLSTWGAEFKEFTSKLVKARIAQGKALPRRDSGPSPHGRVIMHVDMDSFFVSVTLRDKPHLRGKPVAVCHAGRGNSTDIGEGQPSRRLSPEKLPSFFTSMSEIASCSYQARASGVRNGMLLGAARQLCPDILCVPYEFHKYRQVSQKLYEILVSYTHEIEAVSCDEAYLDVSRRLDENTSPTDLAQMIRDDIHQATGCTASAGISFNVLLARMCTKKAKPNGQFYLSRSNDVQEFMAPHSVRDLPGVGWALTDKLQSLNIRTCADLQKLSLQTLQRHFGAKSGTSLHQASRGIDDRPLRTEHKRKSVSAEINYGIRFTKNSEADRFIEELALEVQKRLRAIDMKGKCVTLKLKVRKAGAPMPRKFMGHGICDNLARSCVLPMATDESHVIARECVTLLRDVKVHAEDMRGMGIQVSKLSPSSGSRGARTLLDFVNLQAGTSHGSGASGAENDEGRRASASLSTDGGAGDVQPTSSVNALPPLPRFSPPMTPFRTASFSSHDDGLPSPSQVDPNVLAALPDDIRRSIEKSYAARNLQLPVSVAQTPKYKNQGPFHSPLATNIASPAWKKSRPTPSRVDPDFLAALPDDLREEVELAYRLRMPEGKQETPRTHRGKETTTTAGRSPNLALVESNGGVEPSNKAKEISLGGAVILADVKKVLREWTRQCEAPLEEDVQEVSDYLLKLIDGNDLEQASSVLKVLSRAIRGVQEPTAWQSALDILTGLARESIRERYNSRLVL